MIVQISTSNLYFGYKIFNHFTVISHNTRKLAWSKRHKSQPTKKRTKREM